MLLLALTWTIGYINLGRFNVIIALNLPRLIYPMVHVSASRSMSAAHVFSINFFCRYSMFPLSVSCQIHQRKKKNPDDVHEVPVEPCHFDRRVMSRGKFSEPR